MRIDVSDRGWHIIAGAVIGAVVSAGVEIVGSLISGEEVDWTAASGAVTGALAASGVGLVASVAVNAAVGGASSIASDVLHDEEINVAKATSGFIIGGVTGFIGGSGANGANLRGIYTTSKTVLKTSVSPSKIARYTTKIAAVKTTVAKSTARYVSGSIFSAWAIWDWENSEIHGNIN